MKLIRCAVLCAAVAHSVMGGQAAPPNSSPTGMTVKEREFLGNYLRESEAEFVETIRGLTEAQYRFRPREGAWSAADLLEHVALVEDATFPAILKNIVQGTRATPEWKGPTGPRVRDQAFIMALTNRTTRKLVSPERFVPTNRWPTKHEAIAAFVAIRARARAYADTTRDDLRVHFADHPVVGIVDAYQWLLFLPSHTERHFLQLREVMTDAAFPAASAAPGPR